MIVVAVENFNVDTRLGHPARDFAKLPRLRLVQPLDEHVPLGENPNARCFERAARGTSIFEEKVRYALTVNHECASALDTDSGAAQDIAHLGERTRPVLQRDGQVFHGRVRSYESIMRKILYR